MDQIKKTAAAYIRVSTEDQIEFSPDSQIKRIQEYAMYHDFNLPEKFIFLDEGISGRYAKKRPEFMRMIGLAKQKPRPFEVILVWKFSRFSRNRQESIFYKSMLRKECGIDVISITEQLSDDPTSILIEALLEAMDEYYSINLAQEVRRGMNEKFSRGGVVSIPPFGYKMGENHFIIDEKRAPYVRMIFDDFLNGKSTRSIAVKLNEMGVRTIRGNLFEKRSVEYILSNPTYTGKLRRKMRRNKEKGDKEICLAEKNTENILKNHEMMYLKNVNEMLVQGEHEAIIDEKIFWAAQKRLQELKEKYPQYGREAGRKHALQGLVKCSNCGASLVLTDKGKSMQCHKYAKGLCEESHHIRVGKLQQLLEKTILEENAKIDLLKVLHETQISETDKNERLHAFIKKIIFDRKKNKVTIIYRK